MEVLELYYNPGVSSEDGDENSTRLPRGHPTKKKEEKININETNKLWIKKGKYEAYEPHQESAEKYSRDNKVNNLKIGMEKEENFNTNDAPESDSSILNLIKTSPEVILVKVVLGKDRNLAPDPKQKSADMD
ncbi:30333_t:CDS:2, partial [Gigaspora margarita]